jgi:dTDP-4-amino-4,6-dideoxygalactose transaminase/nucleoside-diphosphate-sugar epimerase
VNGDAGARREPWVVVGGSGFVGTAVVARLLAAGHAVTVVDRHPPRPRAQGAVPWLSLDLLEADAVELPPGRVAVLIGSSEPAPARPWTLGLDHVFATARLAPALRDRAVVVASSVEVYGRAGAPLRESTASVLPAAPAELVEWVARVCSMAAEGPCPPWRAAPLCRELAAHDPSGRWVYAMAKRAQELVLRDAGAASLRVVRVGNVVGVGQERVLTTLVRSGRADRVVRITRPAQRSFVALDDVVTALVEHDAPGVWNIGGHVVALDDAAAIVGDCVDRPLRVEWTAAPADDSCGIVDSGSYLDAGGRFTPFTTLVEDLVDGLARERGPVFAPPMPVVTPARPVRPDVVATRQADALWHGRLKAGQRWSSEVTDVLAARLGLTDALEWTVLPTTSGTAALRLAIAAVAGPARDGAVALVPSYTFPATAEAAIQLGYVPRFVDVDADTWTLDPAALARALEHERVGVVIGVDTFGNPLDYDRLRRLCADAGVPFIADSAAALGSTVGGKPVGSQADAHAFSMSFAKTIIAGGAGGALVVPRDRAARLAGPGGWDRSEAMAELHAIAALDQLTELDAVVGRRRRLAARYRSQLAGSGLVPQTPAPATDPVLAHFVVRVVDGDRDALAQTLVRLGIETKPYFPALHLTTHSDPSGAPYPLPVTDRLHHQALALPLSSEMSDRDVDGVLVGIERALARVEPAESGAASVAV